MTDQVLQPGEVVEVSEAVGAAHLAAEPDGFFIGWDEPDWDYYHARREADAVNAAV